ncbi:MAG: hypothetical protein ACE5JI_17865 [Acidobacteriota bacterium]
MASNNVRFIYGHLTERKTVTGSSEATGFPAENAVDLDRSSVWKGDTTGTDSIKVDLGSAKAVSGVGIANHNLKTLIDGGATIELHKSSDNFVANDVLVFLVVPTSDNDYYGTFASTTERYWRLQATNGAGTAMQIGEFYLGTNQELTQNPEVGMDDEIVSHNLLSRSFGGVSVIRQLGRQTRRFAMTWTALNATERDEIKIVVTTQLGSLKPFFYAPRSDTSTSPQGEGFFVRFESNSFRVKERFTGVFSLTATLVEEQ